LSISRNLGYCTDAMEAYAIAAQLVIDAHIFTHKGQKASKAHFKPR